MTILVSMSSITWSGAVGVVRYDEAPGPPEDIYGSTVQDASAVSHFARDTDTWDHWERVHGATPAGHSFEDYAYRESPSDNGTESEVQAGEPCPTEADTAASDTVDGL